MTVPGEVADALVALLQSPSSQTALVNAITAGEVPIESAMLAFIDGLKATGAMGIVFNSLKGSIDGEIKALFASLQPASLAALITSAAVQEAKNLGG